jgi:peptidoglycan-N-acetylmuramic acid deacetylase
LENKRIKIHFAILYGVIVVLALVVLILSLALSMDSDKPQETTADTTKHHEQTTNTTENQGASDTTASGTSTTAQTTYPPATIPVSTTSIGGSSVVVEKRELPVMDVDMKNYLLSLDNTLRGWGPGSSLDENNRPYGAISAQKTYGKYGSSYIMDDNKIYLTFDEGYENGYTEKILDVLKDKNVKAVFFITMSYAKNEPALVQRMIDEGHIVGNHSTAHLSFPGMTLEDAYADIKALHDYVYENFGYSMKLFRFPMGESSNRMQALLQELGYVSVFWSFAYRDWETNNQPAHDEAFEKITSLAHPGAVYLLHAVSKTNTELLSDVIDDFRGKGYNIALYPVN